MHVKKTKEYSAVCGLKNRKRLKLMAYISIYKKYITMQISQWHLHKFIQFDNTAYKYKE